MKYQTFVTKALFRQNAWFFIPYLLFLVTASLFLVQHDKGSMVLLLNKQSNPVLDQIFLYYTYVGDGFFGAAITILLLFYNRRQGILLGTALVLAGALSQVLKYTVGAEAMRPEVYFLHTQHFRDIPGLIRHAIHSMPSGHTTSAFCMFMMLSLLDRKRSYGYLFFILALLTGISRIYLAQHFLDDVLAGSFLGVTVAIFVYLGFNRKLDNPGMNKPLLAKS
ncbi:MAG: phosphatase PAP2 family protein [Bacteroidetes bacterium]|nr:phosphatase PAP2 family protein [Bacteroidota bacterium]